MPSSTASGYDEATWAVDGCPADCVIYALENLYPDAPPHVVLSGINDSQNVGNVNVPLATDNPDGVSLLGPQDCESTTENPQDDIEAFFNGYVSITPVPRNTTCPDE
jgi:broad specificity polyphosphatase/5'/3'-nucleotidase SurE